MTYRETMNKIITALVLACIASHTAAAPRTYGSCMRACAEVGPSTAKNEQFAHNMATLNDEKSKETDPQKLALLKEREASLIEKHEDDTEKLCRHMCEGLPQP
jgi:hypothetical protein